MEYNDIIKQLSISEKKVLLALKKLNGNAAPREIFNNGKFQNEVEIMNAASWLQSKKLVKLEEIVKTRYYLGDEGTEFLEKGLPERRALKLLLINNGKILLSNLSEVLEKSEIPVAIGWIKKKGWADINNIEGKRVLEITKKGLKYQNLLDKDEEILKFLNDNPNTEINKSKYLPLLSRKKILVEKEYVSINILLTDIGYEIVKKEIDIREEISQITSSIIKKGDWELKNIRPYDIHTFSPSIYGGKAHPLIYLIENIKKIFIEMGFSEIQGDFVESAFWNMDMLFIPQDHPAREMQDTLYCKEPSRINTLNKNLINKIKSVHENGGETTSIGWDYTFSKSEGTRTLLRTHTTVNTIRYLYNHPSPPSKIFSIGQVFRKENIDSTHLPEFYQIEGIIHEKDTNFRQLIGILKQFYKRIGFEEIRFRPAYFPYTEPSMEVEVFWNDEWMELGGSGIFRPEVTEPIGIKNPVLAWGLGLERLAMLKFGLTDIRDLYISDLKWLRNQILK